MQSERYIFAFLVEPQITNVALGSGDIVEHIPGTAGAGGT